MEPYEQDIKWLLAKRPRSTEADQYAFADKVAELNICYGDEENEARNKAFMMLENGELSV